MKLLHITLIVFTKDSFCQQYIVLIYCDHVWPLITCWKVRALESSILILFTEDGTLGGTVVPAIAGPSGGANGHLRQPATCAMYGRLSHVNVPVY